jgi:uncharacterized protein
MLPAGNKKRSLTFRLARGLFGAISLAYLLVVGTIWYAQEKILFHPRRIVDVTPGDSGVKFENVTLPLNADRLAGWWIPSDDPQARTLLYLHGNAGNISGNLDQALRLRSTGLNVFLFDYRGFGRSTGGPPREKLVYEDAERAWQYLVEERKILSANIAIYGHSIGGAVAVNLTSNHPEAGALITECTFTSIAERADLESFTAFLPIRLILTERFDSILKIRSVHVPKLFLQGEADAMLPPVMAHRLYDAAPAPKQIALIPGGGHEDSAEVNPGAYFGALNAFLSQYGFKPRVDAIKGQ